MSAYVPPSAEVDAEMLARVGANFRRLLACSRLAKEVQHVTEELVVHMELLLDAYEALHQGGADGHGEFGELSCSDAAVQARLDPLDLRERVSESLVHARSLIAQARAVNPPEGGTTK